jgi:hypothetical protein
VGSKEGRTWIIDAFVYFLPVIFLWVLATLWVGSSLGVQIKFFEGVRTSLFADYRPDYFNQSFKSLKLAIFGEVLTDSELPADGLTGLESALQGLVPTATLGSGTFEWTMTPEFSPTVDTVDNTQPTATQILKNTPTRHIATETQAPIQTPTPTASNVIPTATPKREIIIPLLECVKDNKDGTLTAFFGYKNQNAYLVEIPIGEHNRFTPGSEDRGQPTKFNPGRSNEYPDASFQVVFDGESITWTLDGGSVTASGKSNYCDPVIPEQTKDREPPQLSDGVVKPTPGDLDVCSITITVEELRVIDPAISSGMAWVKLKYNVEGYTTDYIYSNPLTLCSGGWTEEGGWDGCYSGSIVITIDPNWIPPDPSTPFKINLYAKARDNEGNDTCYFLGHYTMPACCGKCE